MPSEINNGRAPDELFRIETAAGPILIPIYNTLNILPPDFFDGYTDPPAPPGTTADCTCHTIGPHGHDPACPSPDAAEWAAECVEFGCHTTDEDQTA